MTLASPSPSQTCTPLFLIGDLDLALHGQLGFLPPVPPAFGELAGGFLRPEAGPVVACVPRVSAGGGALHLVPRGDQRHRVVAAHADDDLAPRMEVPGLVALGRPAEAHLVAVVVVAGLEEAPVAAAVEDRAELVQARPRRALLQPGLPGQHAGGDDGVALVDLDAAHVASRQKMFRAILSRIRLARSALLIALKSAFPSASRMLSPRGWASATKR